MFEVTYVEIKDSSPYGSNRNTRFALIDGVIRVQYWNSAEGYYKPWEKYLPDVQQHETRKFWELIKADPNAVRENGELV